MSENNQTLKHGPQFWARAIMRMPHMHISIIMVLTVL
jgi:hypothetical protein